MKSPREGFINDEGKSCETCKYGYQANKGNANCPAVPGPPCGTGGKLHKWELREDLRFSKEQAPDAVPKPANKASTPMPDSISLMESSLDAALEAEAKRKLAKEYLESRLGVDDIGSLYRNDYLVPKDDTKSLLSERGSRYGVFGTLAELEQDLMACLRAHANWEEKLSPAHRLAIGMIVHKTCRIVNGTDPTYADNWDDIAGYAKLGKEPKQ